MHDHHGQEHHTKRFMEDPPAAHDFDRGSQGNTLPRVERMVMHGGPPAGKLWSVGVIQLQNPVIDNRPDHPA